MKKYEAMFIFKADLENEQLEKEISEVLEIIKTQGQGDASFDNLGKKSLAYPVKKANEGVYVCYNFMAPASAIVKIKEEIKHRTAILRTMFINRE